MVAVLVTTDKRGVFFGYLPEFPSDAPATITLERARNCVYWTQQTRGVFGLASKGPESGCRIGPAVPRLTLEGVTAVALCTDLAASRWEEGPWR